MPYKIKGKCIYKKDTNKKVGCTKGSVKKYMKALHANIKESINECYDYKKVIITDDKSEASVYFTLTKSPGAEIGLVFSMPNADYQYGVIKNTKEQTMYKFEDPQEAKEVLKKYGLKPSDIEGEMYQQAYEHIESQSKQPEEALAFESLYKQIMNLEKE